MKTIILCLFIFIGHLSDLNSQTIEHTKIISANKRVSNNNLNFNLVVGNLGQEFILPFKDASSTQREINNILVYPNPTSSIIQIEQSFKEQLFFKIYDYNGRVIKPKELLNQYNTFDIASFESGVYIVKIVSQQNEILLYKKIIKI